MSPDLASSDHPGGAPGPCTIEGFCLGPFETNSYVIYPGGTRKGRPCWIVDPSFGPGQLIERVLELGLKPSLLILTHAHIDHIAGVDEVLRSFPGLPVVIHQLESRWLGDPELNLGAAIGMNVTCHGPDRTLREGEELELGGSRWRVLHTPGHSPGGISLVCDDQRVAIVGDTLFAGSIGRYDLPGADGRTLAESIREKLYRLPDDTIAYPGHGPETTVGREKRTNPFVRG